MTRLVALQKKALQSIIQITDNPYNIFVASEII